MTNQVIGEILFAGIDSGSGDWVYTPWMPVRGDHATFAVEVLQNNGTVLTWDVETRTRESATASSVFDTTKPSFSSGATGVQTKMDESTGQSIQELVRYRFGTGGTASTTSYVVFRALSPSWQIDR